jgi:beta-lactamase regulating signal transducer with metallopeptidase domain
VDAALNWLWQGVIVALAWFVMLRALERARARVRYLVCWAALLLVAALPALPPLWAAGPAGTFAIAPDEAIVSLPHAWWTSILALTALWTGWATIYALRFLSAIAALRRTRTGSRPFPAHVESTLPCWNRVRVEGRRATLVLSDSVSAAAVFGVGPSLIAVAPSLVEALDAAELDRVLIHEWAHVQRRDDVGNMLQVLVRIVAGWHPAIWWIDRRLRVEREIACDELTVAITGSPKSYAECLVHLSSVRSTTSTVSAAPAILASSDLRRRVMKIVSPHSWIAPMWSRAIAAAIVSALCVMAAGVGGIDLIEEASFTPPPFESLETRMADRAGRPMAASLPGRTPDGNSLPRDTVAPTRSDERQDAKAPSPPPANGAPAKDEARAPAAVNPVETLPLPPAGGAVDLAGLLPGTRMNKTVLSPPEPRAAAEQPQSPWAAAAHGGITLGVKSKDASLATAGFFTRFAHRMSGSR